MEKIRAEKDKTPRIIVTGRIKKEISRMMDKFLSKSTLTKSQLIEIALYEYMSRDEIEQNKKAKSISCQK